MPLVPPTGDPSGAGNSFRAPAGSKWIAHVITDIVTIGSLFGLAAMGLIPGLVAAAAIAAVQAGYVIQVKRGGPPASILVGAAGALVEMLGRFKA